MDDYKIDVGVTEEYCNTLRKFVCNTQQALDEIIHEATFASAFWQDKRYDEMMNIFAKIGAKLRLAFEDFTEVLNYMDDKLYWYKKYMDEGDY